MEESQKRAPRFVIKGLRIIYDTGVSYWSAPVVNISETGIFIETTHELPAGKRVIIIPDFGEIEEQLPFEIHLHSRRIGVPFESPPISLTIILNLIGWLMKYNLLLLLFKIQKGL